MLKDSDGLYHFANGYVPKNPLSDPVFLSPTFCGRDWENEDGWSIVYWLDANNEPNICKECKKIDESI